MASNGLIEPRIDLLLLKGDGYQPSSYQWATWPPVDWLPKIDRFIRRFWVSAQRSLAKIVCVAELLTRKPWDGGRLCAVLPRHDRDQSIPNDPITEPSTS